MNDPKYPRVISLTFGIMVWYIGTSNGDIFEKTHLIWNKKSVKKSPFKKNVVKSIFGIEVGFTLKPFLYPDTKTIL